jgi:hypothetical protein
MRPTDDGTTTAHALTPATPTAAPRSNQTARARTSPRRTRRTPAPACAFHPPPRRPRLTPSPSDGRLPSSKAAEGAGGGVGSIKTDAPRRAPHTPPQTQKRPRNFSSHDRRQKQSRIKTGQQAPGTKQQGSLSEGNRQQAPWVGGRLQYPLLPVAGCLLPHPHYALCTMH